MLTLGQAAWDIINKQAGCVSCNLFSACWINSRDLQVFKEPKVDQEVITKLIPSLISLGVQDQINTFRSKLSIFHQKSEESTTESVVEVKGVSEKNEKSKKKSKTKKVRDGFLL